MAARISHRIRSTRAPRDKAQGRSRARPDVGPRDKGQASLARWAVGQCTRLEGRSRCLLPAAVSGWTAGLSAAAPGLQRCSTAQLTPGARRPPSEPPGPPPDLRPYHTYHSTLKPSPLLFAGLPAACARARTTDPARAYASGHWPLVAPFRAPSKPAQGPGASSWPVPLPPALFCLLRSLTFRALPLRPATGRPGVTLALRGLWSPRSLASADA